MIDETGGLMGLALFIVVFGVMILIIRWLGAWMLRIDEVISNLQKLRNEQASNHAAQQALLKRLVELQKQKPQD